MSKKGSGRLEKHYGLPVSSGQTILQPGVTPAFSLSLLGPESPEPSSQARRGLQVITAGGRGSWPQIPGESWE